MKVIIPLLLAAALSIPIPAHAQSSGVTAGLSAIGQALGLGSQVFGLGEQAHTWNSQPPTTYHQTGEPCFLQLGNQLVPGRFYPVEKADGRTEPECVQVQQP